MSFSSTRRSRTAVLSVAALSTVALLAGCASTGGSTPEEPTASSASALPTDFIPGTLDQSIADLVPAEIADTGELHVAGGPGYAPFYLLSEDGSTLIGADIETVHAIGDVLGLEVVFEDIKFDAMIPALQTNRVPMAAGGFSITPERLEAVDFVSNFSGGTSLIVPAGNPKEIDLESMCGRVIAVQKGTVYADNYMPIFNEECIAAGEDAIDVQVFPTQPDATLALSTGRADASMSDYGPLAYVAALSDGQLEVLKENYDPSTWGFAFPNDSGFAPAVAAAMNKLIDDGTYEEILVKWGVESGAITESEVFTDAAE
jgi:polar amino acid transport system substrate-binding protein